MRFVAVDRNAAEEIISDRFLQSVEYEKGQILSNILRGNLSSKSISPRLRIVEHEEGVFFLRGSDHSADCVIFDLVTCRIFGDEYSDPDILLYFQKTLRFAVKIWAGMRLSATEKPIQSSSKAVVFPYPISQHTSFRIVVELSPDNERQSKRPSDGRCLLVYRCGTDEGAGPHESPEVTTFRRFLSARRSLPAEVVEKTTSESAAAIRSFAVTSLDGLQQPQLSPLQGYESWIQLLTDKQRQFVAATLKVPHRIEGPAGTGKTVCLVLKALYDLLHAKETHREHKALFVTHSEATRRTIELMIRANDPGEFLREGLSRDSLPQTLNLTTLQQLCGNLLRREITESEFLDRDAMESKQLQTLYVYEAFASAMKEDYATHKEFLSSGFRQLLETTEHWTVAEMMQHEISVVIKGRAEEKLENYRKLPRLAYGLPTETTKDRGFVWVIFKRYQAQLQTVAQFDTDDIVLTTIGQLDTPIWRRRREREGYDSIYIDETHLFNMNELSIFHHLTRANTQYPIAYSVDRSQAVGDRGWTDELFQEAFDPTAREETRVEVRSIFRCSPEIVDLAFSVTSGGATLFTNFDDPLEMASSMFTAEEERKCATPALTRCGDDDALVTETFAKAEQLRTDLDSSRCDIALVAFSDDLFKKAKAYAEAHNKPVELLKQRGDIEVIKRAERSKRFVLSTPEYIGGLEFQGVVLMGVDDGRVPPTKTLESTDSANFLSYASHNRLYVAISRARFRVEILIVSERGPSRLLLAALKSGALLDTTSEDVGQRRRVGSA